MITMIDDGVCVDGVAGTVAVQYRVGVVDVARRSVGSKLRRAAVSWLRCLTLPRVLVVLCSGRRERVSFDGSGMTRVCVVDCVVCVC